jgi:hypothetical protein
LVGGVICEQKDKKHIMKKQNTVIPHYRNGFVTGIIAAPGQVPVLELNTSPDFRKDTLSLTVLSANFLRSGFPAVQIVSNSLANIVSDVEAVLSRISLWNHEFVIESNHTSSDFYFYTITRSKQPKTGGK